MTRTNFNWQELDLNFFKEEIFERYWTREPGTLEKVIEIQTLQPMGEEHRLFFGAGINVLDYREWNKETVDLIEKCNMFLKMIPGVDKSKFRNINDCQISVCTISKDYGPLVSPIGAVPDHYALVKHVYFGEELSNELKRSVGLFMEAGKNKKSDVLIPAWYYKENGYYKVGEELRKDKENKILIRIWNLLDWKEMIKSYINSGFKFPDYVNKDDISKDLIVSCP